MSVIPTAAWITPQTALFGSGSGVLPSTFPNGIIFGSNPESLLSYQSGYFGSPLPCVANPANGTPQSWNASLLLVGNYSTINPPTYTPGAQYGNNYILYQSQDIYTVPFLNTNQANFVPGERAFALNSISSLKDPDAGTIKMGQLASTIPGYGWANVS